MLGKSDRVCFPAGGSSSYQINVTLKKKLLLAPVILFAGLELILWAFVRIPLEPLKTIDLVNHFPGLKNDVRLVFDKQLARYLDNESGSKPAGTVRILCLGGSATLAMFQNADDTWWGKLGRQLQAKGQKVQVAAWGQDRTGIVASTPVAALMMEDWQPDIVIADYGFDDVVGQPVEYRYQPEKAGGLPAPVRAAGWKQAILKVSQTARLGRLMARRREEGEIQNNIGRTDFWTKMLADIKKERSAAKVQMLPARDTVHDPLLEYMDGWKVLQNLCNRFGAKLIMTGEPSLHDSTNNFSQQENLMAMIPMKSQTGPDAKYVRPDPAWVEKEMTRYASAAETWAQANGIPWLNLNGKVPRDLEHFLNDVILTDAGAAQMAAELQPIVEAEVVKKK